MEQKKVESACKWNGDLNSCGNETCWDLQECQGNPKKVESPDVPFDSGHETRKALQNYHQVLIARNYNNIGKWSNERQDYNFQVIQEIEKILIDNAPKTGF